MIFARSAMLYLSRKLVRPYLILVSAGLLAVALPAQQTTRDYSVSDATGDVLAKYKVAIDGKDLDGAIAILDAQMAKVEAGGYDLALLNQYKANTLLQKGDFSRSIEPIERGLALSDAKTPPYFEERVSHELVYYLAQLYAQEAQQSKNPSVIAANFDKAEKYITRWVQSEKKPTADNQLFYARLLFSKAVQNADHPDLELIKRALVQIEFGLHLTARPKDDLYLFKLLCLLQLNRNDESAEILEILLKQKPDSAVYWQQLAGLYVNAQTQETRAILTIERAQANGHLNSPNYHHMLVSLYFNVGQYEKAAELLQTGLKSGRIENDIKNWETLASCFQQLERPLKAIEALKEAAKAFPKSGELELMIARLYQSMYKPDDALPHAQAAVTKGELARPHQAYLYLAYVAYEVKKYELALEAARKAAEFPDGASEAKKMAKAIEDIIKDRETKKARN